MKILFFIFYIIDHSVCDQLLPYLKQYPNKCLTTYWEKYILNSNPVFLDEAT